MKSEHRWLAALPPHFGAKRPDVIVGIGDDAAVLAPSPLSSLLTVDAAVEGVHFTRAIASFYDVGYRSFMAAASDIAAMAGRPRAALSALTVPPDVGEADLDALVAGQADAARALGVAVVGGNVATGPCLSITTTVLGACERAVERAGARPGEGLYAWGALGLAAAGLRALLRGEGAAPELREAIEAWRRPRALIEEAWAVRALASAAIDVSDGLGQDAGHLARASGVRLVLDEARVLEQGGGVLAVAAARLGLDPVVLALAGGEDYALLVTSGHDLTTYGGRLIGHVEAGTPEVLVEGPLGRRLAPAGFDHGRETPGAGRRARGAGRGARNAGRGARDVRARALLAGAGHARAAERATNALHDGVAVLAARHRRITIGRGRQRVGVVGRRHRGGVAAQGGAAGAQARGRHARSHLLGVRLVARVFGQRRGRQVHRGRGGGRRFGARRQRGWCFVTALAPVASGPEGDEGAGQQERTEQGGGGLGHGHPRDDEREGQPEGSHPRGSSPCTRLNAACEGRRA